eukprot:3980278-Amphidinium_carterae.1
MVYVWQMGGSTVAQQRRQPVSGAVLVAQCCADLDPLALTIVIATRLSKTASSTGTVHLIHGYDRPSGLIHPD